MEINIERIEELGSSNFYKVLECSSKGDKQFSAFYAQVKAFGKVDSIENHYQLCKRFPEAPRTWRDAKGKTPTHICLNDHDLPIELLSEWYACLWIKYLDRHPALVAYAQQFDIFHDAFRGKSINCQADMIRIYVKEGRHELLKHGARLWAIMEGWRKKLR